MVSPVPVSFELATICSIVGLPSGFVADMLDMMMCAGPIACNDRIDCHSNFSLLSRPSTALVICLPRSCLDNRSMRHSLHDSYGCLLQFEIIRRENVREWQNLISIHVDTRLIDILQNRRACAMGRGKEVTYEFIVITNDGIANCKRDGMRRGVRTWTLTVLHVWTLRFDQTNVFGDDLQELTGAHVAR